jgi:hypothetical protein
VVDIILAVEAMVAVVVAEEATVGATVEAAAADMATTACLILAVV